jgi:predicted ArsR family transcriptional regulator
VKLAPIPLAILKDLLISSSTADSTAGRLGLPEEQIKLQLRNLLSQDLVEAQPLQQLTVWQLTCTGRTKALEN